MKVPADSSMISRSTVPEAPNTSIEPAVVVVAPPHGAGTCPNQISFPETRSVASEPAVIVAVTFPLAKEHDSAHADPVCTRPTPTNAARTTTSLARPTMCNPLEVSRKEPCWEIIH